MKSAASKRCGEAARFSCRAAVPRITPIAVLPAEVTVGDIVGLVIGSDAPGPNALAKPKFNSDTQLHISRLTALRDRGR